MLSARGPAQGLLSAQPRAAPSPECGGPLSLSLPGAGGALVDQSFTQVGAGRLTRVMVSGGPGLRLRLWLGLPLSSRVGSVGFLT